MTYLLKFDAGATRGAHRITMSGLGDRAAWELAGKLVTQHVVDTRFRSAWSDDLPTDCIGWETKTDGVVCYVVGSVQNWRALHAGKMTIATFDFVEQLLESRGGGLAAVGIESRELQPASCDVRAGQEPWPWSVNRESGEATEVIVTGELGSRKLEALAAELDGVLRLETAATDWPAHDYWHDAVNVRGNRISLPKPLACGNVLESIYVWQQLWWADITAISFE